MLRTIYKLFMKLMYQKSTQEYRQVSLMSKYGSVIVAIKKFFNGPFYVYMVIINQSIILWERLINL